MSESGPRKKMSVVVPVYFNEASLPHLFTKLQWLEAELATLSLDLELIFVDDGSLDGSWKALLDIRGARPATKLIKLSRNFGAVAASNTGFQFVTGDCFMVLSADLQDPVEQLLLMVRHWLDGRKFVISVRKERVDPLMTRLFAATFYVIVRNLVLESYPKGGFDLMLMDRALLPHLAGSSAHTNPNMLAYWLGFEPTVLEYKREERRFGKSRWTFRKKLKFFLDTVTGFSTAPIRLVSWLGVAVAMLSFVYGVWIAINAALGRIEAQGFATLAVLVSFFSGLILMSLGIVGEYLWRIFDLVNHKPKSVIDVTLLAPDGQSSPAAQLEGSTSSG
ncbi:MAG: glycosyltransferase family 2 protein [Myxococcaceae bacterium]|nr:glycosyltransferase family 2 protein [Myxococcaceae bacterium]